MRVWVTLLLLAGCAHREPAPTAAPPTGLTCNHCHATVEQATRISPAVPWARMDPRRPGLAQQIQHCASRRQGRALGASELAAMVTEVRQRAVPPRAGPERMWSPQEAQAAAMLDGDAWQGEQLFARACAACHVDGPAPGLDLLRGTARSEVVLKILLPSTDPTTLMPAFPRSRMSAQDAADIAAYVAGEQ